MWICTFWCILFHNTLCNSLCSWTWRGQYRLYINCREILVIEYKKFIIFYLQYILTYWEKYQNSKVWWELVFLLWTLIINDLQPEMGHERSNSWTENHSDYVHRCLTRIPVSIVSEPAWNEPAVSQDWDWLIPEPRPASWRWLVHCSEWIKAAQLLAESGRCL